MRTPKWRSAKAGRYFFAFDLESGPVFGGYRSEGSVYITDFLSRKAGREVPYMKFCDGKITVEMPEMDRQARFKMEHFAAFMAEMIRKYGKDVLEEMEKEETDKNA